MALMQKDVNAAHFKGERPHKVKSGEATKKANTADDFEAEDERLWQQEFNDSLDILSDLADQALADYEAGRTTRISA